MGARLAGDTRRLKTFKGLFMEVIMKKIFIIFIINIVFILFCFNSFAVSYPAIPNISGFGYYIIATKSGDATFQNMCWLSDQKLNYLNSTTFICPTGVTTHLKRFQCDTSNNVWVLKYDQTFSSGTNLGNSGSTILFSNYDIAYDSSSGQTGIYYIAYLLPSGFSGSTPAPSSDMPSSDSFSGWFSNLGDKIVNGLLDGIKGLFIPSNDFFSNQFNSLKDDLSNKLNLDTYNQIITSFKNVNQGKFEDVFINLPQYGLTNIKILDGSWFGKVADTFHDWIRGLMFILLMFYNYNQVYKLIRGTDMMGVSKTIDHMSGGGDK